MAKIDRPGAFAFLRSSREIWEETRTRKPAPIGGPERIAQETRKDRLQERACTRVGPARGHPMWKTRKSLSLCDEAGNQTLGGDHEDPATATPPVLGAPVAGA